MRRKFPRWMVRLTFAAILFTIFPVEFRAQEGRLEVVESVPVETSLGLDETRRTLPVWLEMIQGAKETINIEIFYLSHQPGEPLQAVLDALLDASRRGVQIHILVDSRMYQTYPETLDWLNEQPNIQVRRLAFFNQRGGVQHAKYFVVDHRDIFIGSQNFDWRALKHIHETGLRIQHAKLARLIEKIFALDWQLAELPSDREISPEMLPAIAPEEIINKEHPISLVFQGDTVLAYPTFSPVGVIFPGMTSDEEAILELLNGAAEQVLVQLLSYNPYYHGEYYDRLDNALRRAAARKAEVRMIVSDWNKRKPGVFYLQSLQVLPGITVKFSTIPISSQGFIPYARVEHCKYLVSDGRRSWVGTSNWARDYFYNSRNLGIVVMGESVANILQKIFQKSWESPYTETIDPCKEYAVPRIGQ